MPRVSQTKAAAVESIQNFYNKYQMSAYVPLDNFLALPEEDLTNVFFLSLGDGRPIFRRNHYWYPPLEI
jgi:hypothetical protein